MSEPKDQTIEDIVEHYLHSLCELKAAEHWVSTARAQAQQATARLQRLLPYQVAVKTSGGALVSLREGCVVIYPWCTELAKPAPDPEHGASPSADPAPEYREGT